MASPCLYRLQDVRKHFLVERNRIDVLNGLNFTVDAGEWVALVGRSGSGKTTLLQLLGGLDRPSSGLIELQGRDLGKMSSRSLTELRRSVIGFVFQSYHLFPELSALENAALPALRWRTRRSEAVSRATELLGKFGLGARLAHRPRELSGGEQQRVAIARALINNPSIILADEPTGNLDRQAADEIIDIFRQLRKDQQRTVIMVTHDLRLAQAADRVITLQNGLATSKQEHGKP